MFFNKSKLTKEELRKHLNEATEYGVMQRIGHMMGSFEHPYPPTISTDKPNEFIGEAPRSRVQFSFSDPSDGNNTATLKPTLKPEEPISPTLAAYRERTLSETFTELLLSWISRKQLRDTDVYKAAEIDRRLFSKIVCDRQYKPSKDTAIALAISLKLTLEESNDFLAHAGYALSHGNDRDIYVEYCILQGDLSVADVNRILYSLKEKPLGKG